MKANGSRALNQAPTLSWNDTVHGAALGRIGHDPALIATPLTQFHAGKSLVSCCRAGSVFR